MTEKHEIRYDVTTDSAERAIDIKNAILMNTTEKEKVLIDITINTTVKVL